MRENYVHDPRSARGKPFLTTAPVNRPAIPIEGYRLVIGAIELRSRFVGSRTREEKKIARSRKRSLDYDRFKTSFRGDTCISVVTRNLDAFDTRYIRIAEYQPVRDVAGCEIP